VFLLLDVDCCVAADCAGNTNLFFHVSCQLGYYTLSSLVCRTSHQEYQQHVRGTVAAEGG